MKPEKITMQDGRLVVPDNPIIPFIEGDGTGPDITRAAQVVWNAAVKAAYGDARKIEWKEVYAGEKANAVFGPNTWLPQETLDACREYLVSIKGPLTTPVGGGIRSINVAMRQQLDLYVCLRPVRWFKGVPSPEVEKVKKFLLEEMGVKKIRFPETASIGIKPVSREGTERLVKAALDYAIANDRKSVTLVHKGNIQKFTEGAFRDWGYALAKRDYGATLIDKGPWCEFKNPKTGRTITVKDCICDAFLQQILTRPAEYDVIATLNLNGDYVSDALAATVGGIGIAPGANINYQTGVAVFEATHGTAPKYANLDKVNPGSLILSGEMMLRYMGWTEAADKIIAAMDKVIAAKTVTYDFARQMEGATEISCSAFGNALAAAM